MRMWKLLLALLLVGCSSERRVLMRHFDPAHLAAVQRDSVPCCFDIAVDHGQQQFPVARQKLLDSGKGLLTYFNVHDIQPEVVRGEWRSPWFAFLADSVMASWGAYLVNAAGDTAFYAFYGGNRYLLNWVAIDSLRAETFAAAQVAAAGEESGGFWDVYFPHLAPWMFAPHGASYESIAPEERFRYQVNAEQGLRIARRALSTGMGQFKPFVSSVLLSGMATASQRPQADVAP